MSCQVVGLQPNQAGLEVTMPALHVIRSLTLVVVWKDLRKLVMINSNVTKQVPLVTKGFITELAKDLICFTQS